MGGAASAGGTHKENGDGAFRKGEYVEALYWYSLAIKESEIISDEININTDSLAVLYSNRSAAYAGHQCPDRAYNDALRCIELRPRWYKGYYRAAVAADGQGDIVGACNMADKAILLRGVQDDDLERFSARLSGRRSQEVSNDNLNQLPNVSAIYSWGEGK